MQLAYVAGPYTGANHNEVHENIEAARLVAIELWRLGYAVICPHLNSAFMSGVVDESVFYEGGIEMLRRCDLVVLFGKWEESTGTMCEIDEAKERGILVCDGIEGLKECAESAAAIKSLLAKGLLVRGAK